MIHTSFKHSKHPIEFVGDSINVGGSIGKGSKRHSPAMQMKRLNPESVTAIATGFLKNKPQGVKRKVSLEVGIYRLKWR